MDNLSELESQVLFLRQKQGYTINETIKELNITVNILKKIIEKLQNLGLYSEEEIQKAKKNRKLRERYAKTKGQPILGLSKEEENFRQLCISFMCEKYLDYNVTKKMNPILVTKLKQLNTYGSYEVIYRTLQTQEKNLNYINSNKTFQSDIQKISYFLAVIKSNMAKVENQLKTKQAVAEAKRNSTSMNEDIIDMLENKTISTPTKRRDLSEFID